MNAEKKVEIPTIAAKNRIINNIFDAINTHHDFLLVGHKNPDEDCIASLVAFGLLLSKLLKNVTIMVCEEVHENFEYLLHICTYNSISISKDCLVSNIRFEVLVLLDTAKPSLLMQDSQIIPVLQDKHILKIELDHHLKADSVYSGDPGYRLVTEASSTCELIGLLAIKLNHREEMMKRYYIENLFSRNLVLAILSGIIGDSKRGKYLKSSKEKWFYNLFSNLFEDMLIRKTFKDSNNLSNMDEVYGELIKLSDREKQCFHYMMEKKKESRFIHYIVLDPMESEHLFSQYGHDVVVTIARSVADKCAETSTYLSLVGYFDPPAISSLIQLRMRRSPNYKGLDLRNIIHVFNIADGGGHEGAVGFRIDRDRVPNFGEFIHNVITETERMIEEEKHE